MPSYGSSSTAGYGTASAGQLRGSVYGTFPENAWVTSITALLGKVPGGSNPSVRMGLYTTENEHPHTLLGQTAAFTVSNAMDYGGASQAYTQSFTAGAIPIPAGGMYAIGIVGTGASVSHAMVHAANSPFTNKYFYYRSGVTGSLPSPFGHTSSSHEGNISAYVTYTANRAPTAATNVPSGLVTTSSVAFQGTFSDADSAYGDYLTKFQYVIQTSTGGAVYDSGWLAANSSESTNGYFVRARTLSPGSYRWQCRVQDRFGSESGYTGWKTFTVHANRAPTASTVQPSGLQTSSTLTFKGNFSDVDEGITGDTLSQFQFQVINNSTKAAVHNSGWLTANSTEITNKQFSRSVTLTAGVPLAWRCQVKDNNGAQSDWTDYKTFTINAGGGADTFGGVLGKQTSKQPTPFTWVWRHASGLQMDRYQIRLGQGSSVIKTGDEVAASAVNNATVTASWAASFGGYSLPWGAKNLWWELRVRDSAGAWVGFMSTDRVFNINAAPSIPSNLTPADSNASANRPLLRCKASDDDGDTLTIKARIKNNAGTVLQTRTMTKNGDWYEYQTTSSDLASYGTYQWDAYSFDGSLYSGEATAEGSAQKSASATFIYASVPSVVLTSPTHNETYAGTVIVTWNSIGNQQAWRIVMVDTLTGAHVTNGNWVTNTATSVTLTAAEYGLLKDHSYSLYVELRDTNGLVGTSASRTVHIDYSLPSPIGLFMATPELVGDDTYPTAIHLVWTPYTEPDFQKYTITRRGTPNAVIATISNPNETAFTDLVPPTGRPVEYSIVLTTLQGVNHLDSQPAVSSAEIELESIILQNVYQANQHIALIYDTDREYEFQDDVVLEMPWGATAPLAIHGTASYQIFNGTFNLYSDNEVSAASQIEALRRLYQSKQTVCYRDVRGRRFFGTITGFSEQDQRIDSYTVRMEITETLYEEGGIA